MNFLTYSGNLTTYFETGMEHLGLGVQVSDDRFKTKNPQYDGNYKNGPEFYLSLEGLILLKPGDRLEIQTPQGTEVFMIGNKPLAREHQYKLGNSYPKEVSLEEISKFVQYFNEELPGKIIRPIKSLAFYGGTFDPIHLGHKAIIEQLHYSFDVVCIIPTNNWTKNNFTFSLEERINAIQAVSNNYLNVQVLDWSLTQDTSSTVEMFNKLKEFYGVEPKIVIGSDNLSGITKWKNFKTLKNLPFLIFERVPFPEKIPLNNYQIYKNFNKNYSSTEIRNKNLINQIPKESLPFLKLEKLVKKIDF